MHSAVLTPASAAKLRTVCFTGTLCRLVRVANVAPAQPRPQGLAGAATAREISPDRAKGDPSAAGRVPRIP